MAKKRGRPSNYSEDTAANILARIANGEKLRDICAEDGMPSAAAVCQWAAEDREGFSERYVRALVARGWYWAEEIVSIADGADASDPDTQRDKLRVDTRKWLLTKLMPSRFGERQQLEHTGKDGGPIKTQASVDLSGLSDEQLRQLYDIARDVADTGAGKPGDDQN